MRCPEEARAPVWHSFCGAHVQAAIHEAEARAREEEREACARLTESSSFGAVTAECALRLAAQLIRSRAHLCRPEDHDPPRKCDQEDHLKAMCQRCHLRLDREEHLRHARETRARRQGVQELPGFSESGKGAPQIVAISDGSQDLHGEAPLAGQPLPPTFQAAPVPDWTQGPTEICKDCGHGTIWRDPAGVPRHRGCEWTRGTRDGRR